MLNVFLSWATISALPCCPAHFAVCFNVFLKHVLLTEHINELMNESYQIVIQPANAIRFFVNLKCQTSIIIVPLLVLNILCLT